MTVVYYLSCNCARYCKLYCHSQSQELVCAIHTAVIRGKCKQAPNYLREILETMFEHQCGEPSRTPHNKYKSIDDNNFGIKKFYVASL
jgi:hypothetical protein